MIKTASRDSLQVLQWFVFIIASSVALPIVIGGVFHLTQPEIATLLQRTLFVVGISSILQAVIGHRFPVMDGPAGSWVSVFIMMAAMATQQGTDLKETLQLLQGGLLVAGALLFLLGITGAFARLLSLFSPLVTNVFLFLLSLQLSGVFLKGMLGIKEGQAGMDYGGALIAFAIFGLVLILTVKGKGWLRNYAVLLGIVSGWVLFVLLHGGQHAANVGASWIQLPELWAWGLPKLNPGMVVTACLFTLILVSNLIAAISAAEQAVPRQQPVGRRDYNRSGMVGGISHGLAAVFSAIGIVPLPVTAGFIRMTGQRRRLPFLIACLALTVVSMIPAIVGFLALLPTAIASGVSLATFVQMTGNTFQSLTQAVQTPRHVTILGIGLVIGFGFILVAASMPPGLPTVINYIFGNGLLIGTMVVLILERVWRPVHK